MNIAALQCNAVATSRTLPPKSRGMRRGSEPSAVVVAGADVDGPRPTVARNGRPDRSAAVGGPTKWGRHRQRLFNTGLVVRCTGRLLIEDRANVRGRGDAAVRPVVAAGTQQ